MPLIEEALGLFRVLAEEDPERYRAQVAETLRFQARIGWPWPRTDEDRDNIPNRRAEALGIYRDLAAEQPERYLPQVAAVLSEIAEEHLHRNTAHARVCLDEMIDIYRQLAVADTGRYEPLPAATLLRRCRRDVAGSDQAALSDAQEAARRYVPLARW